MKTKSVIVTSAAALLAACGAHTQAAAPAAGQPREYKVTGELSQADEFAWSPDGARLAVLGRLVRGVVVLDAATGNTLGRLDDLAGGSGSVGFDAAGRVVAGPRHAPGAAAVLWDVAHGQFASLSGPGGAPGDTSTNQLLSFAVDRASDRLLGIHNLPAGAGFVPRLALYDLRTARLLWTGGGPASQVALAPGGERAAIVGQTGQVEIIDLATGQTRLRIDANRNPVSALAWSPDGQHLATGTSAQGFGRNRATGAFGPLIDTDLLQLWDAGTGRRLAAATDVRAGVGGLDFSPDGRWLAVASATGDVDLRDPLTLAPRRQLERAASPVTVRVRFSPDASRLGVLRTRTGVLALYALAADSNAS